MIANQTGNPWHRQTDSLTYTNLVKLFLDDFIAATNNPYQSHITNLLRAMLHGASSISPSPNFNKHQGHDPISQGKLAQGEGTWATSKLILGWIISGSDFNLQFMPIKCKKIEHLIIKV